VDDATARMMAAREADRLDREAARSRNNEAARARLLRILETKLKTAFVAPLAQIEQAFGALWGGKKHPGDMAPDELAWWERYQRAREAILNNGNGQVRAVQAELALHEVSWLGYRSVLPVGGRTE
jgi:hypothetical protein